MAEFSSSGWTGFFSLSRSSDTAEPSTNLRHFPQISRETPAEPAPAQKDEAGVVSVYTRGSIVPSEGPASIEGAFSRSVANDNVAPPKPQLAVVHVERPPAPRLEMKGPIAVHARAAVRAEQITMRNAAMQAAARKALGRMEASSGGTKRLGVGDEFRQSTRRKHD